MIRSVALVSNVSTGVSVQKMAVSRCLQLSGISAPTRAIRSRRYMPGIFINEKCTVKNERKWRYLIKRVMASLCPSAGAWPH